MVESALNIAAEQVVEWSAHGRLLGREGNRSPLAAPQGLYPCVEGPGPTDKWLALSIATDAQWRALRKVLGEPGWAMDPALDTRAGRRLQRQRPHAVPASRKMVMEPRIRLSLHPGQRSHGITPTARRCLRRLQLVESSWHYYARRHG